MGNAPVAGTAKRGSLSATLSRKSDRKMVSDLAAINQDTHRFSPEEMKWLHGWWFSRFPKLPSLADVLKSVPSSGEHTKLFGQLFRVLDRKRANVLDFDEFVFGCSLTGRGSFDQKLAFLFILMDRDEDRVISRDDTMEVVALIAAFMIKDGPMAARVYNRDQAVDVFQSNELTLTLDKFKQRAVGNAVLDNCTHFFDAVFFSIVENMESDLASAQLFARPLQYTLLREDNSIPAVITLITAHLSATRGQPNAVDLSALFARRLDDAEVLQGASRIAAACVDGATALINAALTDTQDKTIVAAVLKKYLMDLPEPLFMFALFPDLVAAGESDESSNARLETLVQQLPPIHVASLRHLIAFFRDLAARESDAATARERLCVVFAPLLARPKAAEDKEQRARSIRAVARALLTLVLVEELLPPDGSAASAAESKRLFAKLRVAAAESAAARAELDAVRAQMLLLQVETTSQREKLSLQSDAAVKMAKHIAELRQEVTSLKREREAFERANHSPPLADRVADVRNTETAVEAQSRGSNKDVRRAVEKAQDSYTAMTDGATDAVTVTAELICARGLASSKDGKCEAYARVALHHLKTGKNVRKSRTNVQETRDPAWNLKFEYQVSAALLSEFAIEVTLMHRDKFGRDAFLGRASQPLIDLKESSVEDWFPLKQKKPTDKVSGEVHLLVFSGTRPPVDVLDPSSGEARASTLEVYQSKGSIAANAQELKELFEKVKVDNLRALYCDELPATANFIVFDRTQRGSNAGLSTLTSSLTAVSRKKLLELVTSQPKISREPELVVDVLLTLGVWTTPVEFLCELLARYVGPDPASAEAYTRFDVNAKNCRWCVKKVLFEWINNELLGQEFFWCSGLQEAVLTFAQDNDIQLKDLNLALQKSRFGKRKGAQSTVHDTLRFGTRQRRQESVFELPVSTVAEQLTLIEFALLDEIRLEELCGQAWSKDGKETRARNVLSYINWFNRVSHWVATQIIQQPGPVERAAGINRFIEIGAALSALNNFNGVIEILSALHSSAISRLKDTWALVPPKTMTMLEDLDMLMNTDGNFRYYRMLLEKSKPPIVPYMGLLLTDLTFMDDANLTELGKGDAGQKLLNFSKLHMLAGAYRSFRRCISRPYTLSEVKSVNKLLRNLDGFDENELYRLSKLRETPGKAGEAGAKPIPRNASAKLIAQITSTMLTRKTLDIADDSFSAADWDTLCAMDGVVLERKRKGDVLLSENNIVPYLLRVKTGVLVTSLDAEVLWSSKADQLLGQMSVLNPSRLSRVRVAVESDVCEYWMIPRIVVHAMCQQDVDLSRKFYGDMAQGQARLLMSLSVTKQAPVVAEDPDDPIICTWDTSWSTRSAHQKEFTFLGLLVLRRTCLVFSSNMLGFQAREEVPLGTVTSVTIEGNGAVVVSEDRERKVTFAKMFKCLSGFSDTEACVAMINESVGRAERVNTSVSSIRGEALSTLTFAKDPMALTNEDWAALTQGAKKVVARKDEVVMKEGESYQRMYQVVRGGVRVEKIIDGQPRVVARMYCSETFGDMSFLTGSAASATCIADTEECELTVLEGYYVNMLFGMRPDLAGRFYKFLAMLITARVETKLGN